MVSVCAPLTAHPQLESPAGPPAAGRLTAQSTAVLSTPTGVSAGTSLGTQEGTAGETASVTPQPGDRATLHTPFSPFCVPPPRRQPLCLLLKVVVRPEFRAPLSHPAPVSPGAPHPREVHTFSFLFPVVNLSCMGATA